MRSKLTAFSFLVLVAAGLCAATAPEKWVVRCGGPFNLCGFVEWRGPDRTSEEERVPKQFEGAHQFSEGLAAVRIDGRYGYIDPTGRVVIKPKFEAAGPFTGDYAEVWVDGRSGAIDRSGRLLVPAQFDRLVPFTGGAFIARPLRPGAQRSSEHTRLDGEVRLEGLSKMFIGLRGGIYHVSKGWLTAQDLQFSQFDEPARGLIWAGKRNEHGDEQWGLMRADGSWQVTPRYNHVQQIRETNAVVGAMPDYSLPRADRRKRMLRGAVDLDGNLVVPLVYQNVFYWRGGYGTAVEPSTDADTSSIGPMGSPTGRRGILRPDGGLLAGRFFDEVDIREDGKLPRGRIDATWYSIERDGRLVPDQLEGAVFFECPNGLKIVHRGEMIEVQRPRDGKPAGQFDKGHLHQGRCPGPLSVTRNAKYFFVLEDGTVLGEPNGFDNIYSFSANFAAVEVAEKWGIIDRTGAFTVTPKFRKLRPGATDKFIVGEGKDVAWIDGRGARIKAPVVPKPSPGEALSCEGGLRLFAAQGLWGLQDGDGKTVIEPRYRALSCFRQGVTWTASPGGKEWCPLGPDGKRREAMACRVSHYPMIVTHHYPERFSDDPHENSILWTRAWLEFRAGVRSEAPKWVGDGVRSGSYSVISN